MPWEGCCACWDNDDHRNILLCDGCDLEFHHYCVQPPLPDIPSGAQELSQKFLVSEGAIGVIWCCAPQALTICTSGLACVHVCMFCLCMLLFGKPWAQAPTCMYPLALGSF